MAVRSVVCLSFVLWCVGWLVGWSVGWLFARLFGWLAGFVVRADVADVVVVVVADDAVAAAASAAATTTTSGQQPVITFASDPGWTTPFPSYKNSTAVQLPIAFMNDSRNYVNLSFPVTATSATVLTMTGATSTAGFTVAGSGENIIRTDAIKLASSAGTDDDIYNGMRIKLIIADGEGDYTALDMDAGNDDYDGYASSTEFIGFTFKNGPDDEPLINIVGPGVSSNLDWAPTFTNCRFTDTEMSVHDNYAAPIIVENAEPVFDGCEFRNLNLKPSPSYYQNDIYGPIRLIGTQTYSGGGYDTTAFRPQFKNCVIAGNSLKRGSNYNSNQISLNGGAIAVGFGAIPYFENTRIDSNTVDIESGRYGNRDAGFGGGIFLCNYFFRGEYIRFVNCSISGNSVIADEIYGGGIHTQYPAVSFINTVITNNELNGELADNQDWSNAQGGAIHYSTDIYNYENAGGSDAIFDMQF